MRSIKYLFSVLSMVIFIISFSVLKKFLVPYPEVFSLNFFLTLIKNVKLYIFLSIPFSIAVALYVVAIASEKKSKNKIIHWIIVFLPFSLYIISSSPTLGHVSFAISLLLSTLLVTLVPPVKALILERSKISGLQAYVSNFSSKLVIFYFIIFFLSLYFNKVDLTEKIVEGFTGQLEAQIIDENTLKKLIASGYSEKFGRPINPDEIPPEVIEEAMKNAKKMNEQVVATFKAKLREIKGMKLLLQVVMAFIISQLIGLFLLLVRFFHFFIAIFIPKSLILEEDEK